MGLTIARVRRPEAPARVSVVGGRGEQRDWADDDFVDTTSAEPPVENDPWDPNISATSLPALSSPGGPDEKPTVPSDCRDGRDYWGLANEPIDLDPEHRWPECPVDPPSDWAEPDPTIDGSSQLSESLYPPDPTITDVSRSLKIGELLAGVEPITEEQYDRCHEVLSACRIGRLRRWIPWLRNRDWSGTKLRLFLEFRCLWNSQANSRWWETFWWDVREQEWMPSYQSGTLTLDHCLELVNSRGPCKATDVIDPAWFAEWDEHAAWELGVHSFARFAVFRAEIPNADDWLERLSLQDQRSPLDKAQCADDTFAPFMLPSFSQQYGSSSVTGRRPLPPPELPELVGHQRDTW